MTGPDESHERLRPTAHTPLAMLAALVALALASAGCGSAEPAQTRPPGGWIAFVGADPGGIYVMNPDGSAARRISTAIGPGVNWSPDGQQLVFASNPGISVMNADGSGATKLAQLGEEPAWSPDGTRIVFAIRPNLPPGNEPDEAAIQRSKQMHIHVMQVDGSGLVRLTTGSVDDEWPSWSADGRQIAFDRNPLAAVASAGCGSGICVMNADGSELMALAADGSHAAWAPDGGAIAYASSWRETMGIWVSGLDGVAPVNLTVELAAGPEAEFAYPTWAPDGGRVAFAYRPRGSGTDIYVVDRDGSNLTRLTTGVGNVWGVSWR